jgi:hypothetical protein
VQVRDCLPAQAVIEQLGAAKAGAARTLPFRTHTDEHGAFRFRAFHGEGMRIFATARGYSSAVALLKAGVDPVDVGMVAARTLRGRVVTASGKGLARWSVGLADSPWYLAPPGFCVGTATDAQGAFVLDGAPASAFEAIAWEGERSVRQLVPAGVERIEFVLPAEDSLQVLVRGIDHVDVGGMSWGLIAVADGGSLATGGLNGDVGKDGSAKIPGAKPGTSYCVILVHPPMLLPVAWATGAKVDGPLVVLQVTRDDLPGREVTGRVLLPDGSPAARAHVQGRLDGFPLDMVATAVTDAEGRFTLRRLPAKSLQVKVAVDAGGAHCVGTELVDATARDAGDLRLTK